MVRASGAATGATGIGFELDKSECMVSSSEESLITGEIIDARLLIGDFETGVSGAEVVAGVMGVDGSCAFLEAALDGAFF